MPDEFEPPETPEATESHKERIVGLIIATIAIVLAIVTHIGNETENDKILAHVDASDQFAFYQAKKERSIQLNCNPITCTFSSINFRRLAKRKRPSSLPTMTRRSPN